MQENNLQFEKNFFLEIKTVHKDRLFLLGLFIKLLFVFFSYPFIHDLFLPFLKSSILKFNLDPWTSFLNANGDINSFPYGITMLLVYLPLPTIGKEVEIDSLICTTSNVGNPHLMLEVDDVDKFDLDSFSDKARNTDLFKDGVNVEIYSVVDERFIYARVNERGVGETDACGSGALALYSFLRFNNKVQDEAVVLYPGGELDMSFEDGKIYLKGSVTYL